MHMHTHRDMEYWLFLHCNNFCMNAPQCCITCELPVLIMLKMENNVGCVTDSKWRKLFTPIHILYCTQPLQDPHSHERLPFYAHTHTHTHTVSSSTQMLQTTQFAGQRQQLNRKGNSQIPINTPVNCWKGLRSAHKWANTIMKLNH